MPYRSRSDRQSRFCKRMIKAVKPVKFEDASV